MHALIDADIFTYSFGSCTDDEGNPLAWPLVATRLNAQIKNICTAVGATSYTLYITGEGNFRINLATIKPYKGSRPTGKPFWYEQIRKYLVNFRRAVVITGWEADDQLSIEQWKCFEGEWAVTRDDDGCASLDNYAIGETIICSLDKDLNMVPGYHYNWIKDETYHITSTSGLHNFYCQLLTGDTCDNIPGLHGVGKSSTYLKSVRGCSVEYDMFDIVRTQYTARFGAYWWQFLTENAALLWMLQEEPPCGSDPQDEIIKRLTELNDQTLGQNWKRRLVNSLTELR